MEQRSNAEWTPLLRACSQGYLEAVKILVEHGADITAKTPNGTSCLSMAAKHRHFSLIYYLLEQDSCSLDESDAHGNSALHYVSLLNDTSTMQKIISKEADIDSRNQVRC